MREHAIPQDVTGYRFHIIGNMTLKQFAEVGAGCIVGLIIYSTNLPLIIKWPLITLFVAAGAMAAFVPIEERPFDHWIVTFFKTLYKPTKFFWRRDSKLPDPFLYNPNLDNGPMTIEIDLKPARRQRIKEYLTSVQVTAGSQLYDSNELQKMSELMTMFDTVQINTPVDVKTLAEKPDLKVRVRAFRPQQMEMVVHSETTIVTEPAPVMPQPVVEPEYAPSSLADSQLNTAQVGQQISIPTEQYIEVQSSLVADADTQSIVVTNLDERAYSNAQTTTSAFPATQDAVQNTNLPFPAPPTEPNKLVGMVLTPSNDLLNDTIVEITAADGQIVRAVKTNALGQFFITTPLADGTYTISAEKDGYQFPVMQLVLAGQPVAPLEIRSQNVAF